MKTGKLEKSVTWQADFHATEPMLTVCKIHIEKKKVVSGGEDGVARVWHFDPKTHTNSLEFELKGHHQPVNDVAISPDGNLLATSATDLKVYVYELSQKGQRI